MRKSRRSAGWPTHAKKLPRWYGGRVCWNICWSILTYRPHKRGRRSALSAAALESRGWKRFNAEGVAGLETRPKAGRPITHTETLRSQVIELAVQKPNTLGYPFALWTLRRLQAAVGERYHLHISASTIWQWLDDEGLEWKRQASWFQEADKHDPEFVEKRGPSSGPT